MSKSQHFTLCQVSQSAQHYVLEVEIPEGVTEEQVIAELEDNAQEIWDEVDRYEFECGAKLKSSYESEEHINPEYVYHRKDCVGMK